MAKSSKKKSDQIKDDQAQEEASPEQDVISDEAPEAPIEDVEDAVLVEDEPEIEDQPEEALIEESVVEAPEHSAQQPTPAAARRGILPFLLGGLAAGGIGYGVETYLDSTQAGDDFAAQIAAQADEIEKLRAEVGAMPTTSDLTAVESQFSETQAGVTSEVAGLQESLSAQLAGLEERLSDVEKRPGSDGTLSDTALRAYEAELEDLRGLLEAQREDVSGMAQQAEADLAAARATAEALEQEAIATAQAAAGRAAINRVAVALENGEPFEALLSDIPNDIPAALTAVAADGVSTAHQLAQDFPAVARGALAAARAEGVAGDESGLGGFFRSQFEIRSTAPREGSDPDAILSRAEAAVNDGRLSDALAEIEALPEVARAEMTDWIAMAQARADALAAISDLTETLNEN